MIFHFVGMMMMLLLMTAGSLASASMPPPQLSSAVMRVSHRSSQSTDSRLLSQIYDIRGGSDSSNENQPSTSSASGEGEPSSSYTTYDAVAQQQQSQINNPNFQSTSSASLSPPPSTSTLAPPQVGDYDSSMNDAPTTNADQPMMYGYNRETVEDRIDAWRKQQQVKKSKNDYLLFIVCILNDRCILYIFCPTH